MEWPGWAIAIGLWMAERWRRITRKARASFLGQFNVELKRPREKKTKVYRYDPQGRPIVEESEETGGFSFRLTWSRGLPSQPPEPDRLQPPDDEDSQEQG